MATEADDCSAVVSESLVLLAVSLPLPFDGVPQCRSAKTVIFSALSSTQALKSSCPKVTFCSKQAAKRANASQGPDAQSTGWSSLRKFTVMFLLSEAEASEEHNRTLSIKELRQMATSAEGPSNLVQTPLVLLFGRWSPSSIGLQGWFCCCCVEAAVAEESEESELAIISSGAAQQIVEVKSTSAKPVLKQSILRRAIICTGCVYVSQNQRESITRSIHRTSKQERENQEEEEETPKYEFS